MLGPRGILVDPTSTTARHARRLSVTSSLARKLAAKHILATFTIVILCISATASASQFTAFGPQVFVRNTGNPVTETVSFTVLDPAAQYTLIVTNGGLEDDENTGDRVSSGKIHVNGVQIFGPSDFGQNVPQVTAPVTLQGANVLSVELRGKPGGAIAVEIIGIDDVPPTITATAEPAANGAGWNDESVTVTFDCLDTTSGIQSCTDPVIVSTDGANQVISGTATDVAGNTATASVMLNIDTSVPTIQSSVVPPANAQGWHNADATVSFACTDALSGVASCSGPVTIATEGATQNVTGTATDVAGNTANASASVSLDTEPPELSITSPSSGDTTSQPNIELAGSVSDSLSSVDQVLCNNSPATIASGIYSCEIELVSGNNNIIVSASDVAGNAISEAIDVIFDEGGVDPDPIIITIDSPRTGLLTRGNSVAISGTVSDGVSSVQIGTQTIAVNGGAFLATVPLTEGSNRLTVVGGTAGRAAAASVIVVRDTTEPVIVVSQPIDDSLFTTQTITVAGDIVDIRSSVAAAEEVLVFVNGVRASTLNGSFEVPDMLLQPGLNTLVLTASDTAGNVSEEQISVTYDADAGQRIAEELGNNQVGRVGNTLADALVVRLVDRNGAPIAGRTVTYSIAQGDGNLLAGLATGREVSLQSDAQGLVSAQFVLGARAGSGNQQVRVSSAGFVGEIVFCATAEPLLPSRVDVVRGHHQTAATSSLAGEPLMARVVDQFGNPIEGVDIEFTVATGSGQVNGQTNGFSRSDSNGIAFVEFTLGPEVGVNKQSVVATFFGNEGRQAQFFATGVVAGAVTDTMVSGIVLDNSNMPIPGATVSIKDTNLSTLTNAQGQFELPGAPVADLDLIIDGTTTSRAGQWPSLEFQFVSVSGHNNTIDSPIYLPEIDQVSGKIVGGDEDVVLEMSGVEGATVTVFANSATFPDGSKTGLMWLTQVNSDKLPMIPPNSSSPSTAGTFQPAGVAFDPPAKVTMPNRGDEAGSSSELFSFDHDIAEFVNLGTTTVSEDGRIAQSDPGRGIVKSGWFGRIAAIIPPSTDQCSCNDNNACTFDTCGSGGCNFEPLSNIACEDDGEICTQDICMAGVCEHIGEPRDGDSCQDDENVCTDDICMSGTCTHPTEPKDGESCEDDLLCTLGDICEAGVCQPGPDNEPPDTPCDDKDSTICTTGLCDGAGTCVPTPDDDAVPEQASTTDCVDNVCSGGDETTEPNDDEDPPQTAEGDCTTEICQAGDVVEASDDTDLPGDTLCQTCSAGDLVDKPNGMICNDGNQTDECLGQVCMSGACVEGAIRVGSTCATCDSNSSDNSTCVDCRCQVDGTCDRNIRATPGSSFSCTPDQLPPGQFPQCFVGLCELDGSCDFSPVPRGTGFCNPGDMCATGFCDGNGGCEPDPASFPTFNGNACNTNPPISQEELQCTTGLCSEGACITEFQPGSCNLTQQISDSCQVAACQPTSGGTRGVCGVSLLTQNEPCGRLGPNGQLCSLSGNCNSLGQCVGGVATGEEGCEEKPLDAIDIPIEISHIIPQDHAGLEGLFGVVPVLVALEPAIEIIGNTIRKTEMPFFDSNGDVFLMSGVTFTGDNRSFLSPSQFSSTPGATFRARSFINLRFDPNEAAFEDAFTLTSTLPDYTQSGPGSSFERITSLSPNLTCFRKNLFAVGDGTCLTPEAKADDIILPPLRMHPRLQGLAVFKSVRPVNSVPAGGFVINDDGDRLNDFSTYRIDPCAPNMPHCAIVSATMSNILALPRFGADVDWTFVLVLDMTDSSDPQFVLRGSHDTFPAYSIYLGDQQIYSFDYVTRTNSAGEPVSGGGALLLPEENIRILGRERSGSITFRDEP